MPAFTFEIVRLDEAASVAAVVKISDEQAVWCHVEALALRMRDSSGAYIRVKNEKGETIIRTGVATALASIDKCPCPICPLKKEREGGVSTRRPATSDLAVDFVPCQKRGLCSVVCSADEMSPAVEPPLQSAAGQG